MSKVTIGLMVCNEATYVRQTIESIQHQAFQDFELLIGDNASTDGSSEIIAEMDDWVTYDLPEHLVGVAFKGKYKGQRQKWFALRFTGQDSEIDLAAHDPEFSDFQWVSLDALPALIVPFKRETYKAVIAAFQNLA